MKKLVLGLPLLFLLSRPICAFGQDQEAIRSVVSSELGAMHLPIKASFCLAVLPAKDMTSEGGADPSPELMSSLQRAGMRPRRASACYKALRGNVISVETLSNGENAIRLKVEFTDLRVPQDVHFATLLRSGVYELVRTKDHAWTIQSYSLSK